MTLNLFTFNNYYNRIVKRFETIDEYEENGTLLYSYTERNFNPNDGVATSAVFNYNGVQPDYCIATDEYGMIVSRWFVIDGVRTRGGQYLVSLIRDLVSDYYDIVVNSPCFIEKATIKDIDSPFIFNKENMTYNQIRTEQKFLYDSSNCSWIVGYVPENFTGGEVSTVVNYSEDVDFSVDGIENWEFWDKVNNDKIIKVNQFGLQADVRTISMYAGVGAGLDTQNHVNETNVTVFPDNDPHYPIYKTSTNYERLFASDITAQNADLATYRPVYGGLRGKYAVVGAQGFLTEGSCFLLTSLIQQTNLFKARLQQEVYGVLTNEGWDFRNTDTLYQLNGKVVHDTATNVYYRVVANYDTADIKQYPVQSDEFARAVSASVATLPRPEGFDEWWWPSLPKNRMKTSTECQKLNFNLVQLNYSVKTTLDNAQAPNLSDAPYKMFCIPNGPITCILGDSEEFVNDPLVGLSLASQIGVKLGTENVWDLQLLPYCPVSEAITPDGKLDLRRLKYSLIVSSEPGPDAKNWGALCWCYKSNFSDTIPANIPKGSTVLERKVNTETVMYRLCSPNGAGQFELDAEMNDGVSAWEFSCTYKPFQPFIQVKPLFGGLYGIETLTDYRGLICGGDFSLPQLSDAWANYQLTNKTYQEQFDREIQNLKITQKGARWKETVGAVSSILSGSVAAGVSGSPLATTNLFTGAITSGANLAINDRLREETLDYRQDMFGFQLANIQAIPQSITKTAANVVNNPHVPYVEKYEARDKEKEALINKLKYNGMTIGVIGTIREYIGDEESYIKGQLIRLPGLEDDYHVANALAAEVSKGVFI